jgi:hypothetical protein
MRTSNHINGDLGIKEPVSLDQSGHCTVAKIKDSDDSFV